MTANISVITYPTDSFDVTPPFPAGPVTLPASMVPPANPRKHFSDVPDRLANPSIPQGTRPGWIDSVVGGHTKLDIKMRLCP